VRGQEPPAERYRRLSFRCNLLLLLPLPLLLLLLLLMMML
jgi:hypothetical protein